MLSEALNSTFDSLRGFAGSFTWGPLLRTARYGVQSLLERIEVGELVITDEHGVVTRYGKAGASPRAELKINKETFWVRLMLFADMVSGSRSTERGASLTTVVGIRGELHAR